MARCEETLMERTRVIAIVPCPRAAKWKVTFYTGQTELVCGYCKGKLMRAFKDWPEDKQPKFEKL